MLRWRPTKGTRRKDATAMKEQRVYAAQMNVARFERLLEEGHEPETSERLKELLRTSREELDLARLEADPNDAARLDGRDRAPGRADNWRAKAEELRTSAETMQHPTSRETLMRLADSYDLLARQAEEREVGAGSAWRAGGGEDGA